MTTLHLQEPAFGAGERPPRAGMVHIAATLVNTALSLPVRERDSIAGERDDTFRRLIRIGTGIVLLAQGWGLTA